jgi:alpha-1,3-rhamnosyl/mannosyltransferase
MAGAVACLYPSDYEGFGLPVVEAMASGCPVVTLRNSALTESGGDAAVYLDRADPEGVAAALDRLSDDAGHRDDRVRAGLGQAAKFRGIGFADGIREAIREAGRGSV